ncbi:MAG: hypothetical protein R3Y04_05770 [Rikenellaceae bacterium]
MKKGVKKFLEVLAVISMVLILLPVLLSILLQLESVQSALLEKFSYIASNKVGVKVELGSVKLRGYNKLEVKDFWVENPYHQGDTLFYISEVEASITSINIPNLSFGLGRAAAKGGGIYIEADSSSIVNVKRVVDKLKPEVRSEKIFKLHIDEIELDSFCVAFVKILKRQNFTAGIDYEDMRLNDISVRASDFNLFRDSIIAELKHISLREKSGVVINEVITNSLTVSPTTISAAESYVEIENSSFNLSGLSLHYNNWNMVDFVNDVYMKASITSSDVDMSTVEKFTGHRRNWLSKINFAGSCEGYVSDLTCNIARLTAYNSTILSSTLRLQGLPNIDTTLFSLSLNDLHTDYADVSKLAYDFTGKTPNVSILKSLGWVDMNGVFNGRIDDFRSTGSLRTLSGNVDFVVSNTSHNEAFKIDGALNVSNMNGEAILGVKSLKNVSFKGNVNSFIGKDSVDIVVNSTIDNARFRDYNYSNIDVNGSFKDKLFRGEIVARDPNLVFDFKGLIHLENNIPRYDFTMDIEKADLYALNLDLRDTISYFSGNIIANGSGSKIDSLNGEISFENFYFVNRIDTVRVGKVEIKTQNSDINKSIILTSDFADVNITAKQSYTYIIPYFINTVEKYLPSLQHGEIDINSLKFLNDIATSKEVESAENSYYVAVVNVKEANNMASIFVPGLNVAKDSKLSFIFNPALDEFSLSAKSESITFDNYEFLNIDVLSRSETDSISFYVSIDELSIKNIFLPNFTIMGGIKDNNIDISTHFNNSYDNSSALIALKTIFSRNSNNDGTRIVSQVLPSFIVLSGNRWVINESQFTVDSARVDVDNFSFHSDNQYFEATGVVSKFESDTLTINMSRFNLSDFSFFTKKLGYTFEGYLNGEAKLYNRGKNYGFKTNLEVDDFKLNDYAIPTLYIKSTELNALSSSMFYTLSTAENRLIEAEVDFDSGKFDAKAKFVDVDLQPLEPLMKVVGSNCSGVVDIDITLDNLDRPLRVNGSVDIKDFQTTIDFTNVHYKMQGKAEIIDNVYTLKEATITDPLGVSAPLNGSLNGGDRYSKVRYNINVEPRGLLCLNTTLDDNPLFYGSVSGSGKLEVNGHGNNVTMSIVASVVNNSKFFMPLTDKASIVEADFISFVKPPVEERDESERDFFNFKLKDMGVVSSQFEMDINITVSNDTEVQLVIDPTLGDIIKARGLGELSMSINPQKEIFTMTGGYQISEGSYLFTLPTFKLINKYFVIQPGSSINWTGDPLGANLNVTASYLTRTSLAPILGSTYSSRVDVDCNLSLAGKLLKPDITLGITVPDVDPETQSLLSSYLNTEEAISKQIFWLLFSNSFYTDVATSATSVTVGMVGTASAVTGIEFLSNQISNWISNDKFDLGFNYLPRSEMTSDELELNFSAPLLNNRLLIEAEGNYDFKNNTAYLTSNSKTLAGNFYVTYLLDKSGNLQTKAFTRQIDSFDENQGLQENGVGIYYKEDFDKFREIIERYRALVKRIRARRKARRQGS